MPSFDVVSELNMHEVTNAVDQAAREIATRFDFKNTGSSIELGDGEVRLASKNEDRLGAACEVLKERFVRRKVSLKSLEFGKVEEASGATVRQVVTLKAGIDSDKARELNKFVKGLGVKGVQSQTQGEQLRITSKKRDDLQTVMTALREGDFGIPLQFTNRRD